MNPYDLAATSPSSWRVYLFRHLGSGRTRTPFGVERDEESTTERGRVKRSGVAVARHPSGRLGTIAR